MTGSAYIGSGTTGGGELTAIAYCSKAKGPILTEVASTPAPVPSGMNASATTPDCPSGLRLTATGFSLDSRNAFYAGSSLNDDGTSTANAFGYFGARYGFEILVTKGGSERLMLAYIGALQSIGVDAQMRSIDSPQLIGRINTFDFDIRDYLIG